MTTTLFEPSEREQIYENEILVYQELLGLPSNHPLPKRTSAEIIGQEAHIRSVNFNGQRVQTEALLKLRYCYLLTSVQIWFSYSSWQVTLATAFPLCMQLLVYSLVLILA